MNLLWAWPQAWTSSCHCKRVRKQFFKDCFGLLPLQWQINDKLVKKSLKGAHWHFLLEALSAAKRALGLSKKAPKRRNDFFTNPPINSFQMKNYYMLAMSGKPSPKGFRKNLTSYVRDSLRKKQGWFLQSFWYYWPIEELDYKITIGLSTLKSITN